MPKRSRFRRKILLVDDSKTFQSVFKATFNTDACELFICSTGQEAITLISSRYIDFICSSYYLPDMEGIELCQRVRQQTKTIAKPFVLLTSVDNNANNTALPAGVTDIFHRQDILQLLAFISRFPSSHARMTGRILYVEDNRSQRDVLKAILQHRGLTVDSFASAEEALQHFKDHDYDLVLTDIVLDGPMSGLALVNQIRRTTSSKGDIPIIAVTAFDDKTRRIELFNLGVTDYIHKPVVKEELFARISYLLENQRMAHRVEHAQQQLHENELRQAEKKINELAFFDQLTGLPNRVLLLDRLKQAMSASTQNQCHIALLLIDLDKFKTINETLGHDMGDQLLKQVAKRLSHSVRSGDTVARLGGDEFVVMLANLNTREALAATQTENIGEKILAELNRTYHFDAIAHHSTPSIGVTLFCGEQTDVESLLKQAELAMYKSKEAGRNALHFFDQDMETKVTRYANMENDLRVAVQQQQFVLHYQPQVVDQQLIGVEALVRWQKADGSMVSPADFIPMAEETGLILPLGLWVLETACRQLAAWASQPERAHLTIAVNVSAHQFRQADFVDQVLEVLKNSSAEPHRLKLELTESLLLTDVEEIIEKMIALKLTGVSFSLDDFGTGYSSLSYLKRLPLDQLKIDQSFVRDVLIDPNDAAIARTIITLAQSLGLGVIAEGVETEAQREFLAGAGCHAYQGYLFSKPLHIDDFESFIQRRHQ
ncbi:MAG: EAL domain-containing protein [Nitrosomonadales bacterium]